MCVWWRTYLLHIWIRETEETAAIMTPLYLFFFSRLLWHISDQMRSYNWLYGRSPSWSNVSVYRLMSPYCQRSRYRNKSDQVIIYCWFNTGEVFTDRGSGLSHYSPAEEIMTCRCSAVAAKLVFLFFSFLFFIIILRSCRVLLQPSLLLPPDSLVSHSVTSLEMFSFWNLWAFSHLYFVSVAVLEKPRHCNYYRTPVTAELSCYMFVPLEGRR